MGKVEDETDPKTMRDLFDYNPETGDLIWKPRPIEMFPTENAFNGWNTRYAGKIAGSFYSNGYMRVGLFGRDHLAHRVVWAWVYGNWPKKQIDHINGVRDDNRIANLRDVSRRENHKNVAKPINNTSGRIGVCWDNTRGKWLAYIKIRPKFINLGTFDSFEDACEARVKAEKKYGFHENHGRDQTQEMEG